MFKDFYDPILDRCISIDASNRDKAIDYLISKGVGGNDAVEHVDNCLKKVKLNGLTDSEAITLLIEKGYTKSQAQDTINSSIYDRITFSFPKDYPVKTLYFTISINESHAELSITANTLISLQRLSNLLIPKNERIYPTKETYHDWVTGYNRLAQIYNISIYFNDDAKTMQELLVNIFSKLETIKLNDNSTVDYHETFITCMTFLNNFIIAREANFPGGIISFRESPPLATADKLVPPSNLIRELYHAIDKRDLNKVKYLLRKGVNPNTLFWGVSLISYCLPNGNDERVPVTDLISIFSLMIEYGAEINRSGNYGDSLLADIIFLGLQETDCKKYTALESMVKLILLIDDGKTHSYIEPLQLKHPFIQLVAEGQDLVSKIKFGEEARLSLIENKNFPTKINELFFYARILFKNEKEILFVRTMSLENALKNKDIAARMFFLFENSETWKSKLTKEEIVKNYLEVVHDIQGEAYIDLVYYNNQIVGYNIAQIVNVKKDEKKLVIHHIKLALREPDLEKFRGIMFFVTHSRGFLYKGKHLDTTVLNAFEAASPASKFQIDFLEHYPKQVTLEPYMKLLSDTVYANVKDRLFYDKKNMFWCMKDKLAKYEKKYQSKKWQTRSSIAVERFFPEPSRKDASVIVMYKANKYNIKQYHLHLLKFINLSNANENFLTQTSFKAKL